MLTKEAQSLDPEVAAEAVKRMMPLSNPVKLLRLVSETSHPYFVKKIDSSPNQTRKSTVECILFMPSVGASDDDTFGTVWCGLGSGFIQILEMPTGVVECRMKAHKDRVTCLLSIGDHVWSGSFDACILVIDTRTRRSVAVCATCADELTPVYPCMTHPLWGECFQLISSSTSLPFIVSAGSRRH